MSILYNGDYRIIDLQQWHTWWPWVPIQLTDNWGWQKGPWRWLYAVERRIDYEGTFGKVVAGGGMGYDPPYTYVWEYRDIEGISDAEYTTLRFA